jgi:hypothetical protein
MLFMEQQHVQLEIAGGEALTARSIPLPLIFPRQMLVSLPVQEVA